MKRTFLFFLLMCSALLVLADHQEVVIVHQKGGDHFNYPIPADQPDVYYDSVNQEIIIDGTGYVYYYDVEITSTTNWTVYIIAQVSGYYGTVDISSLPVGDYVITIDSPTGNSFEGFFDTY